MKHLTLLFAVLSIGVVSNVFQSSFEQTQITLNTDKSSYGPGDLVSITGTISGASNQYVAIQVKDPSGNLIVIRTVQTDSNGNFALQFKVPTTATSGNFEIDANAKINGQVATATKSIMQTVPEFGSLAGLIIAMSIIGVIIFSRRFRFQYE
jgi:predicted secreted protein with PEFG-CTERM motif